MILCTILFSCVMMGYTNCDAVTHPIVETSFGKILGKYDDGYYSFHNIPYAEPPVGNHRFEPPIPYTGKWSEERDGSQAMTTCIKFGKYEPSPYGHEDCLFVHIATPAISCEKPYPVRIHIHGGGFMTGGPDNSDTSILVKHGMVVATMGYRLGPLGFLSTGDNVLSGNNGLKDQRLAIQWVKANIRAFCGDENNIILSGVSAGGASAHIHLLKKSTENYVNGVASHGAAINCPWAFETNPKVVSKSFAEFLNCPTDSENLKLCLENKSIDELLEATSSLQLYKGNPFTVFAPVVEHADSNDPFITEHPEEIMRNGKAANVTWLVGYAEREGACNAAEFLTLDKDGKTDFNILNERWMEMAPFMLFYKNSKTVEEQNEYSTFLKSKYLGEKEFSEANYRMLEDMYTDVLFNNDIEKSIELHRKHCPGKVYVYYYKYLHNYTIGNLLSGRNDISFGADHLADTIFIIPMLVIKQESLSERDKLVSKTFLDMYINWANNGVLSFGGKDLPSKDGKLTINETCFSIDGCADENDPECSCIEYK